jgi:release factor glutamine methyltransferase
VIALSLAARFPEAEIHGIDLSQDALDLARENAGRLGALERIRFSQGHLLEGIDGEYDLIVANLPYVATSEALQLAREVQHDPAIALYGGAQGDELIRELIGTAPPHLRSGAWLVLEIGHDQATRLMRFLEEKNYHDITAKKDYAGNPRFLFARHG